MLSVAELLRQGWCGDGDNYLPLFSTLELLSTPGIAFYTIVFIC